MSSDAAGILFVLLTTIYFLAPKEAEKEEKMFATRNYDEVVAYFTQQKATDNWDTCMRKEVKFKGIANAPILAPSYVEEFDTTPESIDECMATTKMVAEYPTENGMLIRPFALTAWTAMLERYKSNCGSLSSLQNRKEMDEIPSEIKAANLNNVAPYLRGNAIILRRDSLIQYMGSGTYCPLPVIDLLNSLTEKMAEKFEYFTFIKCAADRELSTVLFDLNDDDLAEKIHQKIGADYDAILEFVTSDVGLKAASLYPFIKNKERTIMIGAPLKLTHDDGHTPEMFGELVPQIMSMFTTAADKISELATVEIYNVRGCFISLAKTLIPTGLKKSIAQEIADVIESKYPYGCTALDIFYELECAVRRNESARGNTNLSATLSMQEMLARVINCKFAEHDHVDNF